MKRMIAAAVVGVSVLSMGVQAWADTGPATGPATTNAAAVKKSRVGAIRLSERLRERPESFHLSIFDLSGSAEKATSLSGLIVTLNKAAKDETLAGLFVDLSAFSLTLNQAQELGELFSNVRKSGKRIAVYSSDFDTATYVLASFADTVIMPENGNVLVPGVGLQMIFFKGTLDKLHLQPDFVQVGKFKGAEEPFMRTTPSPEYKEQIEKLVDGMYTQIVGTVATNRPNMTEADVKKVIDEGWLTGKHAKELGLVDQLLTRDRVDAWVESQFPAGAKLVEDYGKPAKKSLDMSSPFAIFSLLGEGTKPKAKGPAVAVIYAIGQIVPDFVGGEDSTELVSPGSMRKAVEKALKDDQVKAIVLRVDSPGGSASASDEIWAVLKEADKKKPVTVSMGRVAASGGYYIACAGRSIVADPATITGSIGVVAGKLVISGALEKIGINIETVSRGKHATMLSMLHPFTDEEKEFLKKSMEETYGVFTSRVKGARGAKIANLEDVAQGRLFTGVQAKDAGLVDSVGTLHDAVLAAAKKAGIEKDYQIEVLPEAKSLGDILREGLAGGETSLPLGLKVDGMEAVVRALPAEVRGEVQGAMRMMGVLQREGMVMVGPGLVESTR
jgi:protease IV